MRSRYSAYAMDELGYINETWHPDFRPSNLMPEQGLRWIGLDIVNAPPATEERASVEFEARFLLDGRVDGLHERSGFVRDAGSWLYTQGDQLPLSFKPWKPGRNESCPCGSGHKFKRCCGR
jgi:SEC-C motif-containing protein